VRWSGNKEGESSWGDHIRKKSFRTWSEQRGGSEEGRKKKREKKEWTNVEAMGERMKNEKRREGTSMCLEREQNAGVPSDEGKKERKTKKRKKNRAFAPCLFEGGKRVLMGFRRVLGEKEKRESCVGIRGKKE